MVCCLTSQSTAIGHVGMLPPFYGTYQTLECQDIQNVLQYFTIKKYMPGASCSNLTMLLVNDSLKFKKKKNITIHCYFLLIKCENPLHCMDSHIFSKKNNVFAYVVSIYLTS